MPSLNLDDDEALVLFELLASRSDHWRENGFDEAEERVLWKLEGLLKKTLVEFMLPNYGELLAMAKQRLTQ